MSSSNVTPVAPPQLTEAQRLAELEKLLPQLATIARIADKMYGWMMKTGQLPPPAGLEELRCALGVPKPEPRSLIVKSGSFPQFFGGRKKA